MQADGIDNNGHGTHVMGSLLGSPFDLSNVTNLDYRSSAVAATSHQACCMRCVPASATPGLHAVLLVDQGAALSR